MRLTSTRHPKRKQAALEALKASVEHFRCTRVTQIDANFLGDGMIEVSGKAHGTYDDGRHGTCWCYATFADPYGRQASANYIRFHGGHLLGDRIILPD